MKQKMRSVLAILLAVVLTAGMLPAELLGSRIAEAEEAAKETKAVAAVAEATESAIKASQAAFSDIAQTAQARLENRKPEDDGEWQYIVLEEYNYAVISGHRDQGKAQVDIPAMLGGADVVALLPDVFEGHNALCSVTMAGNIYYAAGDALPRGVTVRGYNGSYAEGWAAANRYAFENMSQLDFVSDVVDCSDIDAAHFARHSAYSVTLRALEANRLKEGSVFFLADPQNLYAVSYYQVVSMQETDGFVSIECSTPDVSQVVSSFTFENEKMVADWSTMVLADGVALEGGIPKQRSSGAASISNQMMFTPQFKLGKYGKASFAIGYTSSYTMSGKYANLEMQTYRIDAVESFSVSGKLEASTDQLKDHYDDSDNTSDRIQGLIRQAANLKNPVAKELKVNQPLCNVVLVSLWGFVSLGLEVSFDMSLSGSIEVKYSYTTTTTYNYSGGEMKSTSSKKENSVTVTATAEVKVGVSLSLKLYVFVVDIANIKAFFGVKGTATLEVGATIEGELTGENILDQIENNILSPAYLNMMDCIQLDVSIVGEVSFTLGNKYVSIFSASLTLFEVPMLKAHYHFSPGKWVKQSDGDLGLRLYEEPKTPGEILHAASECPLMDAVSLMVPSIDKKEPLGSVTLFGSETLEYAPELVLPDHRVRVKKWYTDIVLVDEAVFPLAVQSGDKLYGETEKIAYTQLIDCNGWALENENGADAGLTLAEDETVNTADLKLADADHIVGWAYVESPENLTFIGDVIWQKNIDLVGDSEDHTLLAIRDNDLKIVFKDTDGREIGTITTGHFIPILESSVPEIEQPYDPDYAVAVFEWRDMDGNLYEFPTAADAAVGDELTLYASLAVIERIYPEDDSETMLLGGGSGRADGLTVYGTKEYFTYWNDGAGVTITGFCSEQSYEDENGETQTWTAVPEALVIPAYIDGVPVKAIHNNAFIRLTDLVYVSVPSTVEEIGRSAFDSCTALETIDLSACSRLTEIPAYMAYGAEKLNYVAIPGSVTAIGENAFTGCTALTSAVINADVGNGAFMGCTALEDVELRYGVTKIGDNAFRDCGALESLFVPCSVETVGNSFIHGCSSLRTLTFDGGPGELTAGIMDIGENSSLTTLTIGLGVMTIGSGAFSNGSYGNPYLTSITLPDALREVGENALKGTAVEYLEISDLGLLGEGFARDCRTLREVVFKRGVISDFAFYGCESLESVRMGDTVFAIGDHAFEGCISLAEISIGSGVEFIGSSAFGGCAALESVFMGNGVTEIGSYAFAYCRNLKEITLSSNLKRLGSSAFSGCKSLEELHLPASIWYYGVDILRDCTGLKRLTIGGPNTPVLDGLAWIGEIAQSALETLIIGEGVTEIGDYAFVNNSYGGTDHHPNLKNVVLPGTLEKIGKEAFCGANALETVTLPSALKEIGDSAFNGCSDMTLVCEEGLELESIGEWAFAYCASMTGIDLGDSLTSVGNNAFRNCTSLGEIRFPESIESFGREVIFDCTGLKTLSIGGPNTPVLNGEEWLGTIKESALETLIINEGVVEIGDNSFCNSVYVGTDYHVNLKHVSLPSTLERIGNNAFNGANALETVTLPAGLKEIGNSAFYNCSAMKLVCEEGLQLESIGEGAFGYCGSITGIDLGESLVSVGNSAFRGCISLEELYFPASVESFGREVIFDCTGLKTLSIGGPNTPVLNGESWLGTIKESALETLIIGEGVTEIGDNSFYNEVYVGTDYHVNLKNVSLPSTLEKIGNNAFNGASALETVMLPAGLKEIGNSAFYGCSAMTLVCEEGLQLESIGEWAFGNCESMTGIDLGETLKSVGHSAFRNCISLEEIHFPASVESFGREVIYDCTGLKTLSIGGPNTPVLNGETWLGDIKESALETLIIGEGVTEIGDNSFHNEVYVGTDYHVNLKHVSLPGTLEKIGNNAFNGASALETVTLPAGLKEIGNSAFNNCSAMTLICEDGLQLESIGEWAFAYCESITGIDLGEKLKSVGQSAFRNCISLEEIHFPASVESFGREVIYDCTGLKVLSIGGPNTPVLNGESWLGTIKESALETLIIGEGVTEIGDNSFHNEVYVGTDYHVNLKNVSLPSTLEKIGNNAFNGARALETVTLPAGLKEIGNSAFRDCSAMKLVCEDGLQLESIGEWAFGYCSSLTGIDLGESLVSVGHSAFRSCISLEEIHFPASVESFGREVIYDCTGLKVLSIGGPNTPVLNGVSMLGTFKQSALETLIIGEGVTEIGDKSFLNDVYVGTDYHPHLKNISLPDTLEKIGQYAFSGGVTALNLPDSIVSIQNTAFSYCRQLTELHSAGYNAEIERFAGTKLKYVYDSPMTAELVLMNGDEVLYCAETAVGESIAEILAEHAPQNDEESAFAGWSLTPGGAAWNEETMPRGGLTLYADMRSAHTVVFIGICGGEEIFRTEKTVCEGEVIGWPNTPAAEGLRFEGWYEDEDMTAAFASGTVMGARDIAVYGKLTVPGENPSAGYALTLMCGGEVIFTETMQQGAAIARILAQAAPGDADDTTFDVWCTDEALGAEWRLDIMPGFALTLHARMVPVHTVSFAAMDGRNELCRSEVRVGEGMPIPWPEEPEISGYRFEGWYADEQMRTPFSEKASMGCGDITVYGRMSSIGSGAVYASTDGGVELVRYVPAKGETEVWLPSVYQGQPVVSIADQAFADADGIVKLHLPDALMHVNAEAFGAMENLQWIAVGPNCAGYTAVNGVLYTKDMRTLVCFPRSKPAVSLNVPEGVEEIAAHACEDALWLQRVNLSDSVRVLGNYAFAGCKGLASFTAYGLETIGTQAIPTEGGRLEVFGPVKSGALREYMILNENGATAVFRANYNLYGVSLYVDGALKTVIGLEAGSTLPFDFLYGEVTDGRLIHTWYTDSAMSRPWNIADTTPEADFSLYTLTETLYSYETAEFTADGETATGILLTGYNGLGGALVLPDEIDGLPVMGIGEGFLSSCHGTVVSVQIGSSVVSIADSALNGSDAWPFGGVVKADAGSYAAAWAAGMGYTVETGTYTLRFDVNGGSSIADRAVGRDVSVRLPVPAKTGCSFAGWYTDEALTCPVELEEGCFVMPNRNVILYAAWEGEAQQWAFTFEEANGEITIVEYTGGEAELTVPEEINGLPVTGVASHAFSGSENLTAVVLPDSMRSIGSYAFAGSSVESIDLGGAQTVGQYAMAYCKQLEMVHMDGVKNLKNNAFFGCSGLKTIRIPAGLENIGTSAFDGCTALEAFSVDEGNSVYTAADGVLMLMDEILYRYPQAKADARYALPDGASMIMDGAFRSAAKLGQIILPENLMYIGSGAFEDCTALEKFEMTDSMPVMEIPADAFAGCAALKEVVIGSCVSWIGSRAFYGCNRLERIAIPASVTEIADDAFGAGVNPTVYGTFGSEAWRFASENRFRFVDPDAVAVESLAIETGTTLNLGDVVQLQAAVSPADAALCGEILWTSGDAGVIYVYGNEAHAVGVGKAVITAAAPNGVTVSAEFTVENGVRSVVLNMDHALLTMGESIQLAAQVVPADAENASVSWSTSDESVACVDEQGVVTACGSGEALIRATASNGKYAECRVYVVGEVRLSAENIVLTVGQRVKAELNGIPEELANAIRWESSDPAIAMVSGGAIEALSAGEAEVKCIAAEGLEVLLHVTVTESLNTLKLPGMLKQIDAEAFAAAEGVERIAAGENVESVGERAFADIPGLVQVELPAAAHIAPDAFDGSGSAVIFCREGSAAHEFARASGMAYVILETNQ